jgi:hypothetical protein
MAIKGKSRSRSAKAVTRGPKPVYQPVKKPLLARRGLWLVLAGIFGTVVVIGLIAGFIAQRNASEQDDLEERMRDTIARYQGEIEPILAAVGEPAQPAGFRAFAALDDVVADLESGAPEDAAGRRAMLAGADEVIDSADAALDALRQVDESSLLQDRGFSEEFVLYVIDSKADLARAMILYRETAELVKLAAEAEGADREALAIRARGLLDASTDTFQSAYSDYVEAQVKAGTFQPATGTLPIPTGST